MDRDDDVLDLLEQYQSQHPELRVAQIIGNAAQEQGFGKDPYYMEDETLHAYLAAQLEENRE